MGPISTTFSRVVKPNAPQITIPTPTTIRTAANAFIRGSPFCNAEIKRLSLQDRAANRTRQPSHCFDVSTAGLLCAPRLQVVAVDAQSAGPNCRQIGGGSSPPADVTLDLKAITTSVCQNSTTTFPNAPDSTRAWAAPMSSMEKRCSLRRGRSLPASASAAAWVSILP